MEIEGLNEDYKKSIEDDYDDDEYEGADILKEFLNYMMGDLLDNIKDISPECAENMLKDLPEKSESNNQSCKKNEITVSINKEEDISIDSIVSSSTTSKLKEYYEKISKEITRRTGKK